MARESRHHQEAVKVVLIDTHYVVTDPMSFKSVVQSLTGKESSVTWIQESSLSGAPKRKTRFDTDQGANGIAGEENSGNGAGRNGRGDWMFAKGLSFKDLDRMMLELPPVEEWPRLWDQYNL